MKISNEVLAVLSAARIDGRKLFLTGGQLDRALYVETNKVLEAIGGKWSRKEKAHIFEEPVADVLDPVLITGEYSRVKQDFGQFDTPPTIAARVVQIAGVKPGMKALEPSAGVGSIIEELLADGAWVCAYEIDAKRAQRAAVRQYRADGGGLSLTLGDFLSIEPEPVFDRVVMNPPFAKQADIDHVVHAFKFLKPGGRLVAIMSAGTRFRRDEKARSFRAWAACNRSEFLDLPAGAFAPSGTNVNTVVLTLGAP